ncbi:MAG: site-2 protease family protein, partial [Nanoarchaeota archaeon]
LGAAFLYFLVTLTIWIFLLSLGIGLFNLVPLGPIDGGRMFKLVMERLTGSDESGTMIWKLVSWGILGIILVNLVIGFVG